MSANFSLNLSSQGLTTVTVGAVETATYHIEGKLTLPSITNGDSANSAVVVTVSVNGTPKYTGLPGSRGFATAPACTAGDTITIVTSSAAAVDQNSNAIRSTISIWEG